MVNKRQTGTWMNVPNVLAAELMCRDFGSVVRYSAQCIRQCAKQVQGDDASDRHVKQANMRDHAKRLVRLADSLDRRAKRKGGGR